MYWGDLDVLLLDLPPGTGDVAISVGQLLPNAELLVVTTPQVAAAEVAERAGALAPQLHQQVAGVIENMSYLPCPHCGDRIELYGSGGGQAVADDADQAHRHPGAAARAGAASTSRCARAGTRACRWCSATRTPRRPSS